MSACQVFSITKAGNVRYFGEASNAHGGAMTIWCALIERYLQPPEGAGMFIVRGQLSTLWALARDQRLTKPERIVLASTYDNVVVWHDHLLLLIDAFQRWAHIHPEHTTSTIEEEVGLLMAIWKRKPLRGACFNQTSVNADPWRIFGPQGGSRRYNVDRDEGHWELFDHYPELLHASA